LTPVILPSLKGDRDLWNIIVPQPYTKDLLWADELKAKPRITRMDCRIRVPKVLIRRLYPLIKGMARLESLPVSTLKKSYPLPERFGAGLVTVEFQFMDHPATKVNSTHNAPLLGCPWVYWGRRWQRLIGAEAAMPVGVSVFVPALWIAFTEARVAAEIIRKVPLPAPRIALTSDREAQ
jgi:hypothetical protein